MSDVIFTLEDFAALGHVEEFNAEHWKGEPTDLGWKYDVINNSPEIVQVRKSLKIIQDKLDDLREYFSTKEAFQGLGSGIHKITQGRINKYQSHLWLYFIANLEDKQPNEPQLQVSITPQRIDIALWYENSYSINKYFKETAALCSDLILRDMEITLELYKGDIQSDLVKTYKNSELPDLLEHVDRLNSDCKVGITYEIPRDQVLEDGNIEATIEGYLERLIPLLTRKGIEQTLSFMPRHENEEMGASSLILKKKQIILYGPPGTGKTFRTKKLSVGLLTKNGA